MKNKKPQSPTTTKSKQPRRAAATKTMSASGPLPPYGVPIREAIGRGDIREMRRVAASARKWLKDVQASLDAMEKSMKDLEG